MKETIYSIATSTFKNSYDATFVREDGYYYIAFCINEKHYASKCKNEGAKNEIAEWFKLTQLDSKSPKELFDMLLKLTNSSKKFEQSKAGIEAYRDYLRICSGNFLGINIDNGKQPPFPKKSFTLMKEWYNSIIENKQKEYEDSSIDEFSEDVKRELEYTLLNELIIEINNKYISPKPKDGIRKAAAPMGGERKPKIDLIPIKRFSNWLEKRKTDLVQPNIDDSNTLLDLSNTKAVEKLIYLKELGILDSLRTKTPFNTSINQLATILSAITGEKPTTLQSYLNGHFSSAVDKKKDFFSSISAVSKVRGKIIDTGFQLK